jgi:hypothetical protein
VGSTLPVLGEHISSSADREAATAEVELCHLRRCVGKRETAMNGAKKKARLAGKRMAKNGAAVKGRAPVAPAIAGARRGLAAGAKAVAGVAAIPIASQLRVPLTFDPLGQSGANLPDLSQSRLAAASNLFTGIQEVHSNLSALLNALADPPAPPQVISSLVQPDGSPGVFLQVQFDPPSLGTSSPMVTTVSDAKGAFQFPLPTGMRLPAGSSLSLTVHGSSVTVTVNIAAADLASNGLAPAIALPQYVAPLQTSILASLENLVASAPSTSPPSLTNPAQLPAIKLGESGNCLLQYGANSSVDSFTFGAFHRLIEPRASVVSQAEQRQIAAGTFGFLPFYMNANQPAGAGVVGNVSYVDRIPVEQPISVDGFRDQLMGLQQDGTFTSDEMRPMAGTLGLGYTVWLSQRWVFQGLALGNLVYSLPLAPGEQQQVAIFERTDTEAVFESESFTEEQQLTESALADTSTQATFNSAFNEAVNGSSSFQTDSSSSSWGGSLILISGGSGSSSSSGSSQSSLQGQRNTTQNAAQTTHSAAENQANARRSAARTGMRVATASESEQVTTKVITNHNHTRALTMQYWEVHRLYDVTTAIEGLTMTILIPLQVVRFIPAGQPQTLIDPNQLSSRQLLLDRYGAIVKHGDVLAQALPRKFTRGLEMLLEFAADPSAQVDAANASAEDVINFSITGSFLYCETVNITVVTARNTRVGPAFLTRAAVEPPDDVFTSREEFVQWLTLQRQTGSAPLTGAVSLPPSVSRSEVVGFEIRRSFSPASYTLATPNMANLQFLQSFLPGIDFTQTLPTIFNAPNSQRTTITLSPADLESILGGPILLSFNAQVSDGVGPAEQYTQSSAFGTELPQQAYPVAAAHVPPVLKYQQILEIEKMASHVVRRTLTYSRAIWASLSAEERAILLEAYTIGVPPGGIPDATQMVPLLNCVENRVLGFFGNSMMMPFIIPDGLAGQLVEGEVVDPAKIQDALLSYQRDGFQPPHSIIALPTRGVLGEAVLGSCPSAEKIDLTRFWNWQDSPGDTAPSIAPTTLPTTTPSLLSGVTAPNSLTNLPSLINNVLTAPTPDTSLLQALGKNAASQQDFSTALTGASELAGLLTNAQNNANSARADALKTTKDLTAQAMATVGDVVGGMYGSPNAGSNALAAQSGKSPSSGSGSQTGKKGTSTGPGGAGAGPGGAPGGAGAGPGGAPGGAGAGPGGGPGAGAGAGPGGGPGVGAGAGAGAGAADGAGAGAGAGVGADAAGGGDLLAGLDAGSLADLAVLAARRPAPPVQYRRGIGATRAEEDFDDAI